MLELDRNFTDKFNQFYYKKTPFLFIIDYNGKHPIIKSLNNIDPNEILYSIEGINNISTAPPSTNKFVLSPKTIPFTNYQKSFNIVMDNILAGNTFLTNLTLPTNIQFKGTLSDIFHASIAKYKLWIKDKFVVFSPEPFIKIEKGQIFSFPMKGTIDATVPHADKTILNDKKESAEHATIVDLIRNDLSMVAKNVKVSKYRYIEKINTTGTPLLQVSSKIEGKLLPEFNNAPGNILPLILPAGSITGAPKDKTMQIIFDAEKYDRGYYTGIFGIFNGENINSAVMIRFIEQQNNSFVYKSGGGITCFSEADKEYDELNKKIYVPIC